MKMNDGLTWRYPFTEYVDRGEPLEHGITDDPDRLAESWSATLSTLRQEAADADGTHQIVMAAAERIAEQRRLQVEDVL